MRCFWAEHRDPCQKMAGYLGEESLLRRFREIIFKYLHMQISLAAALSRRVWVVDEVKSGTRKSWGWKSGSHQARIDKIRSSKISRSAPASSAHSTFPRSATYTMGKGTDKLYVSETLCADFYERSDFTRLSTYHADSLYRLPILSGLRPTHIPPALGRMCPKKPQTARTSKSYPSTSAPRAYNLSNILSAHQREQYSM